METRLTCSNLDDFTAWMISQMDAQGITVSQLSELSGVHPNTIRNYLRHTCGPTLYNVSCIAKALGYRLWVAPL